MSQQNLEVCNVIYRRAKILKLTEEHCAYIRMFWEHYAYSLSFFFIIIIIIKATQAWNGGFKG